MQQVTRGWKAVGAAVAGPHKGPTGCQDAFALKTIDTGRGPVLVAALADGAGSASHGGDAARLFVAALVDAAQTRLAAREVANGRRRRLWTTTDTRQSFAHARSVLDSAIASSQVARREWGTTALLAVLSAESSVLGRIGDGAFILRIQGSWTAPLWPDMGNYVNVTEFVTHPDVRPQVVRVDAAESALIFSDGLQPLALDYAKQQPFAPFCAAVLGELERAADTTVLAGQLAAWLQSAAIRDRVDDDVSLVMACRE